MLDDWAASDVENTPPDVPYFKRKLAEFGAELRNQSGAERGYCAVTGISVAKFEPIFSFGELTSEVIAADISSELQDVDLLATLPNLRQDNDWFVPLIGQDELYGFFKLFSVTKKSSEPQDISQWGRQLEQLSDHNYTRRVQFLSEPFSERNGKDASLAESATQRRLTWLTALSFGADGAVLRRWDASAGLLKAVEFEGDMPGELLSDRAPGDLLSGAVFNSSSQGWAVIEIGTEVRSRGCPISEETITRLRSLGVRAAISVRLDDPLKKYGEPFGTLAYYFQRPNRFSWRDVTLFLAFSKRASDALALSMEAGELRERNLVIENQSRALTQAEVATLLVHDISHKVFHVGEHGRSLIESVKSHMRNFRAQLPQDLMTISEELQNAVDALQKEVRDLQVVGKVTESEDFPPTTFNVKSVVDELIQSMSLPLSRYKITPSMNIPQDLRIYGAPRVLYHVLLNLLLNTVDAVRTRGRAASVHISATQSTPGYVVLRFWDTGPGINLSKLSSPVDIFKIGISTKNGGTGLGLPMSRNLLGRYFNGSLDLADPKTAMFELKLRKTE